MNNKTVSLIVFGLLLFALPAWAEAPWPGGYRVAQMMVGPLTAWIFGLSLAVQYPFVRLLFGFSPLKSVWVVFCMNTVVVLGYFLPPLSFFTANFLPGFVLFTLLDWRSLSPVLWLIWLTTYLLAVLTNATLESIVVQLHLNTKIDKKSFWGLVVANFISMGVASAGFLLKNPCPH